MKRFFPIIISVILLCSMMLTGCQSSTGTAVSAKDALSLNYEYLNDAFAVDEESDIQYTFAEFTDIISNWADENNINVEKTDEYIILSKGASGEIKNLEDFTFHAAMDFKADSNGCLESAAMIMTLLGNAENHGELVGIFTAVKDGQPVGADALDAEYLNCDNFIDMTYSDKTALYNTYAGSSDMAAVKELDITTPTYTKAYKIHFEGVSYQSAYKNRGNYPNPIKLIGDLLASCQTSTILFELASFEGGSYSDQIPGQVTATIVLHENDVESFTKKFENSYKKVEEAYEELDLDFVYTITPVDTPAEVISKEDTENIVSLMYTIINGTYLRDDNDEVMAYSNIGKVTTKDGVFKLYINAKSFDNEVLTEINGVVKTICGLSDIGYEKIASTNLWANNPESPVVVNFSDLVNVDPTNVMETKYVSPFIEKNSEINLITIGTNIKDLEKDIKKILEYISIAGVETN